MTEARAQLLHHADGVDRIDLAILGLDSFRVYELEPIAAERLLYDLHGIVETLRGVNKPLRWRDRVKKIGKAVRGS